MMKAFVRLFSLVLGLSGCAPTLETACEGQFDCNKGLVCSAGRCVPEGTTTDSEPPIGGSDSKPPANGDVGTTDAHRADAGPADARTADVPVTVADARPDEGAGGEDGGPDIKVPADGGPTDVPILVDAPIQPADVPELPIDVPIPPPDGPPCVPGCISCIASEEICDGQDNNCNGQTDEGVLNACGGCGEVPREICDSEDNDCDDLTDEGLDCECELGAEQECYSGADPELVDVGTCRSGTQLCEFGTWGLCDGEVVPSVEICDGLDNDCNALVDDIAQFGESCAVPGALGVCNQGHIECGPADELVCISNRVLPTGEICNQLDDDCDGQTDEGCNPIPDMALPPPDLGIPPTDTGTPTDRNLPPSDAMEDASPPDAARCIPMVEICDGQDNNCDGQVDEELGLGNRCEVGEGACLRVGVQICSADSTVTCSVQAGAPAAEVCNSIDDDCDGQVDNQEALMCSCPDRPDMQYPTCVDGTPLPCPCFEVCNGLDDDSNGQIDDVEGRGAPCTVGIGQCEEAGVFICGEPGNAALVCSAVPRAPSIEVCDNLDNNCDGQVDEELGLGNRCEVGEGACLRVGVQICSADSTVTCSVQAGAPTAEVCNSVDDDCDGQVDEGLQDLPCETQDPGACKPGHQSCVNGNLTVCSTPLRPGGSEPCEFAPRVMVDDNCSGRTNEGCERCTIGETTRACYNGPMATLNVGSCRAGTATCVGNFDFGPCQGEVLPRPEISGNAEDEDCNGVVSP